MKKHAVVYGLPVTTRENSPLEGYQLIAKNRVGDEQALWFQIGPTEWFAAVPYSVTMVDPDRDDPLAPVNRINVALREHARVMQAYQIWSDHRGLETIDQLGWYVIEVQ